MSIMSLLLVILITFAPSFTRAAWWPVDSGNNPTGGAIQTFWIDPQNLWYNRELINQGRKEIKPALNRVLNYAKVAVADNTVYTVTNKNSTYLPPSGNVNDFYSLARYYWPNSTTATGLPYTRIDGQTNPEIFNIPDATWLSVVIDDVFYLGLAYFFTGDETYAAKAATRIRDWFINSSTRMNPNLNYADWIKGTSNDIITGLQKYNQNGATLVFREVYKLIDGIGLLRNSKSFTSTDYSNIQAWFTTYLYWLENSVRGVADANSQNNVGTWYDAQVIAIRLFLGKSDDALKLQQNTLGRVSVQFALNGSQPLETVRANSWHYSNFNMDAYFVHLALSKSTGINILGYTTTSNVSITSGLQYLIGYALLGGQGWPFPNIGGFSYNSIVQNCKDAYITLRDYKYLTIAEQLSNNTIRTTNIKRLWVPYGAYDTTALLTSDGGYSINQPSTFLIYLQTTMIMLIAFLNL